MRTVSEPTVYQELIAAGCEVDHHESDLYVKATPEARKILRKHDKSESATSPLNLRAFISEGALWFDVPFRYDPWWEARQTTRT